MPKCLEPKFIRIKGKKKQKQKCTTVIKVTQLFPTVPSYLACFTFLMSPRNTDQSKLRMWSWEAQLRSAEKMKLKQKENIS